MPFTSESNRTVRFVGTGGAAAIPWPNQLRKKEDILVALRVDSTGVETLQVEPTDYTVALSTDFDGATITMVVNPAVGETVILTYNTKLTNEDSFLLHNGFPGTLLDQDFDLSATQALTLQAQLDRTVKAQVTDDFDPQIPPMVGKGGFVLEVVDDGDGTFSVGLQAGTTTAIAGPASSINNSLFRADGTTGKVAKNSGVIVDDSDNISGIGTLASGNQTVTGTITASGTIIASAAMTVGTTLAVTGTITSTGTLIATNAATVGTTLAVTGTITSTGTLIATNACTVGTTLGVTGTSTLGIINASGILTVTANIISRNAASIVAAKSTSASGATAGGVLLATSDDSTGNGSGDRLGVLRFGGHNGTAPDVEGATIEGFTTEAWGASALGTKIVAKVTANGATSSTIALTLDQDLTAAFAGAVTIATTLGVTGATTLSSTVDVQGEFNTSGSGINMTWLRYFGVDNGLIVETGVAEPTISTKVWSSGRRVSRVAACPDGANKTVYGSVALPPDYQGNQMRARVYWAPSTTDTGGVLWSIGLHGDSEGDLLSTASTSGAFNVNPTPNGTVDDLHVSETTTTIPHDVAGANISAGAQQFLHFALTRATTNGADTFTGTANLIGIELEFV